MLINALMAFNGKRQPTNEKKRKSTRKAKENLDVFEYWQIDDLQSVIKINSLSNLISSPENTVWISLKNECNCYNDVFKF